MHLDKPRVGREGWNSVSHNRLEKFPEILRNLRKGCSWPLPQTPQTWWKLKCQEIIYYGNKTFILKYWQIYYTNLLTFKDCHC